MHRFFVSEELIEGKEIFFPSDLAHQLARVLRLRPGDRVGVLDNSGVEYEVELHSFDRRSVQGTILGSHEPQSEPRLQLTLYMALLKGKKLDWVFQKGTELGITRFVPILTQRSVVGSLHSLGDVKLDRWEAIVREAAEQSGRARLPEVAEPQLFESALGEAQALGNVGLIAWEDEAGQGLKQLLQQIELPEPPRLALFVGPEGGFAAEEVARARTYGVQPASLGPRILRAESAMIAAATAIFYDLGEWEPRSSPA